MCPQCLEDLEPLSSDVCRLCAQSYASPEALQPDGVCGSCRREPPAYDRLISFGPYEGNLRRAICLLKYNGMEPLAGELGARAASAIPSDLNYDAIVPTPLHRRRRRARGFNQAELLAREVGRRAQRPVLGSLTRIKATPPQAGLSRAERRRNLKGAFRIADRRAVEGKRILLVDDVATTGSTLEACARVLKRAGAVQVLALAVARARPEARG